MQSTNPLPFKPGRLTRMEGFQSGNLTVLRRGGKLNRYASWLCRCTCGAEVVVSGANLRGGKKKSCGINGHRFKLDRPTPLTTEYPSEYKSWRKMRGRCQNPNDHRYEVYGGRGISVCERWNDFKNFMLDMGRKPDPKFTIERDNVHGNYEPGNCRWISRKDQGRNRQNSVFVTYQGKKMLLIDLVEELGLSKPLVYTRLKLGWTLAQAIALPVHTTLAGRKRGRPKGSKNKTAKK